jgi:Endonuclease V
METRPGGFEKAFDYYAPRSIAAIRILKHPFGVICFDGQGYAHPRRCGLATHLSIELADKKRGHH